MPVESDGRLSYELASRASGTKVTETLLAGRTLPAAAGPRASAGGSYFLGDDPQCWRSDLPSYQEVRLGEVWPGVSVSLRAHARNVEKISPIQPGGARRANPPEARRNRAALDRSRWSPRGRRPARRDPVHGPGGLPGTKRPPAASSRCVHPTRLDLPAPYVGDCRMTAANYHRQSRCCCDPPTSAEPTRTPSTPSRWTPRAAKCSSPDCLSTSGSGADGFVARFDPTLTTLLHTTSTSAAAVERRSSASPCTRRPARSMWRVSLPRPTFRARSREPSPPMPEATTASSPSRSMRV